MPHELPALPYAHDALEPHIDARTMEIHHGKHHAGYVSKLNAAIEGDAELEAKSVENLIADLDAVHDETIGIYIRFDRTNCDAPYSVLVFCHFLSFFKELGAEFNFFSIGRTVTESDCFIGMNLGRYYCSPHLGRDRNWYTKCC